MFDLFAPFRKAVDVPTLRFFPGDTVPTPQDGTKFSKAHVSFVNDKPYKGYVDIVDDKTGKKVSRFDILLSDESHARFLEQMEEQGIDVTKTILVAASKEGAMRLMGMRGGYALGVGGGPWD